jgi:glycosyltransferase involved in cell wall biosynthesis
VRGLEHVRVALVHDWLVTWGGAESVLESLAGLFPHAPIYTSLWNPVERVRHTFGDRDIRTTWLQRLPGARTNHRKLLPLMPGAFRALDLSEFDLVISDSHAFSKAVRVRPGAVHVCYCHTPPRYLWDLQKEYLGRGGRTILAPLIGWLKKEDLVAARGVTHFIANSSFVAERINRVYGREARVVHPPVDVERFGAVEPEPGEYFLAGGRLVGYKRVDVAIQAANRGKLPLKVFGDGPERRRLERMAGPTVEFLGWLGPDELARVIARCKALLFPGVEDFGILPVEVMAVGKPVVAYGKGGVTESVVDGVTGVLVEEGEGEGEGEALLAGIRELEARSWERSACRAQGARFSRSRFEGAWAELVEEWFGHKATAEAYHGHE